MKHAMGSTMQSPTGNNELDAQYALIAALRELGAVHIKLAAGAVEALFPPPEMTPIEVEAKDEIYDLKEWASHRPIKP